MEGHSSRSSGSEEGSGEGHRLPKKLRGKFKDKAACMAAVLLWDDHEHTFRVARSDSTRYKLVCIQHNCSVSVLVRFELASLIAFSSFALVPACETPGARLTGNFWRHPSVPRTLAATH